MKDNQLRAAGLKVTLPRIKILKILEDSEERHLTAEDIYKTLIETGDDVGLATVYRVLTQFEGVGLVTRHNFEGGRSVFEMDDGSSHDHIVCSSCGKVKEFSDEKILERMQIVSKELGFTISDHRLVLYGLCSECQEN